MCIRDSLCGDRISALPAGSGSNHGILDCADYFSIQYRCGDYLQPGEQYFYGRDLLSDAGLDSGIAAGGYHGLLYLSVKQL